MGKIIKLTTIVAFAGLLAACDENTNVQNAGIGAATGAGVAAVTGGDVVTGAAVGAAAGAVTNEVKKMAN
ncbi:hypothetical protein R3X27_21485 [Tropicimonas sp. TH_r6]|uniref:hypothetical protein n=1 Tax=Tropicimonas sp. TH_r6 TaxID=3082085 RepID=UPI002952D2D8|nr:hypothetical protein [Tropicimonas sp. TH_r6]MDV7145264.1 hypothetical protein [Tropicimonas sp. TH_r6]